MITKLTHSTRKMIRDAKRQPLKPGAPHTPGSQVPTLAPLFLCRMATPLVPGVSDTELSANTADAFLLNEDDDESPRSRAILSEEITSQPSDSNVVVSGDRSRWAVFGSMLMIQASNENNGFYELSANPTYDEGSDETTFAFTDDLPDRFDLTGNLVRFGPWGLEARVTVRNLSGHMAICAMPGDDIICARVGRELLPICGPQTLFGQVVTTIAAPTIDTGDDDKLTIGSGTVSVYYFDSDEMRTDNGIDVTVYNDWEDVSITADYTIQAQWYGRWMLSQASCDETDATLA